MMLAINDTETEDMNNILPIRVASIFRYHIVKTADVPFGFLPFIDVKVVAATPSRTVPLGVELLAID
jgi:hypothetical protein